MSADIILKYTGGGYGGWLPGIPARDLTADDVTALGLESVAGLLASGLYEQVASEPPAESESDA